MVSIFRLYWYKHLQLNKIIGFQAFLHYRQVTLLQTFFFSSCSFLLQRCLISLDYAYVSQLEKHGDFKKDD